MTDFPRSLPEVERRFPDVAGPPARVSVALSPVVTGVPIPGKHERVRAGTNPPVSRALSTRSPDRQRFRRVWFSVAGISEADPPTGDGAPDFRPGKPGNGGRAAGRDFPPRPDPGSSFPGPLPAREKGILAGARERRSGRRDSVAGFPGRCRSPIPPGDPCTVVPWFPVRCRLPIFLPIRDVFAGVVLGGWRGVPDPHDGLPGGQELARQGPHESTAGSGTGTASAGLGLGRGRSGVAGAGAGGGAGRVIRTSARKPVASLPRRVPARSSTSMACHKASGATLSLIGLCPPGCPRRRPRYRQQGPAGRRSRAGGSCCRASHRRVQPVTQTA